jgi:hypothetical protein
VKHRQRKFFFNLLAVFFLSSLIFSAAAATFYGKVSTEVIQLEGVKYPTYLYVPPRYDPAKKYPLVISLPGMGESGEAHVNSWAKISHAKSLIVLVPTVSLREENVPYRTDEWLLKLKSDITHQYQIFPDRIYLVGNGSAAHYAAYLGVQYPEEFSAVALMNGSWVGPFEKLMQLKSRPRKQVPFYVSLKESDPGLLEKTEKMALRFQEKGYPVYLEKLKAEEDIASEDGRKRMLKWLEEKSQSWRKVVEDSKKSLREKAAMGVEGFFDTK